MLYSIVWGIGLLVLGYCAYISIFFADEKTGDDGVATGYLAKTDPKWAQETKYTQMGPNEVKIQTFDSDNPKIEHYTLVYPQKIEEKSDKTPVVLVVNGTDTPASDYMPILEHLASRGFLVVGNQDPESWSGESTSQTLDFVLDLAKDKKSIFYNKLDLEHIGVMGHSQGGAGAINAVTNYENSHYYTSLYTASAIPASLAKKLQKPYDTSKIKIPYFMMVGEGIQDRVLISPLSSLQTNYDRILASPLTIMARRKEADHRDVLEYGDAYMTAWFLMTLKGSSEAGKVFMGQDAELLNNPNREDIAIKKSDF